MIGALALALALLAPQGGRENRLHLGHVELLGPLQEARFDLGAMGETRVVGPLEVGERRNLRVPLSAWGDPRGVQPEVAVEGEGRARFVGWDEETRAELQRRWLAVPAGLRARPLAVPPAVDRRRPPQAALLVVGALFLVGLALRRRPLAAHLSGAAGAALVLLVAYPERAPEGSAHVREGDGGSGRWTSVHVGRDALSVRLGEATLRVESLPPRASLAWSVELEPERPWRVSAPGALLFELDTWEPRGALHTARNDLLALEEVWVRGAGAPGWVGHPAWPRGEGLRRSSGPADPPGWLNPALPMGTGVLIGRAEPLRIPGQRHWVRLVGFSPP